MHCRPGLAHIFRVIVTICVGPESDHFRHGIQRKQPDTTVRSAGALLRSGEFVMATGPSALIHWLGALAAQAGSGPSLPAVRFHAVRPSPWCITVPGADAPVDARCRGADAEGRRAISTSNSSDGNTTDDLDPGERSIRAS